MANKKIIKSVIIILCSFAIIYVGVWKAKYTASAISFFPINGDFQNYNVIRRLLDGQVPYVDFTNYLGVGVLYVNTAILRVVGNTFADSYIITRIVALLAFSMTICTFFYCISSDFIASLLFTGAVTAFVSNVPYWCSYLPRIIGEKVQNSTFVEVFTSLAEMGNSFRVLRGFVFVIEIAIFCFIIEKHKNWFLHLKVYQQGMLIGFIAGCFVPWSNDWGGACYVSTAFVFFLFMIKRYSIWDISLGTASYIGSSIVGLLIIVFLFTNGHPLAWMRFTIGVSNWQRQYFGTYYHDKIMSLNQLPPFGEQKSFFRFVTLILIVLFLGTVIKVITSKKICIQEMLMAYLSTTLFIYTYLYWIGSSYDEEILWTSASLLYIIPLSFIYILAKQYAENSSRKWVKNAFHIFVLTGILAMSLGCVESGNTYRRAYEVQFPASSDLYIEELGGNIGTYHNDIFEAVQKLKGKTLFSTYASAVECVRDEFQPSGSDYIIHALGDEAREKYIDSFRKTDPDVVGFINRTFSKWEGWATFENWDFYRAVLPDYSYYFDTEYASYYSKSKPGVNVIDTDIDVVIEEISDGEILIHVKTNKNIKHGLADIMVEYTSALQNFNVKKIPLGKIVYATGSGEFLFSNQFEGFFLPAEANGKYLPIEIVDGDGWLKLQLLPVEQVSFEDISAEAIQVIKYDQIERYYTTIGE